MLDRRWNRNAEGIGAERWKGKAAAKSLQSCLTLCDPTDSSPRGSPIHGILQARTLEWVAISFFNAWKWKVKVKLLSLVWLSNPMDCGPPGSSIHGIFHARVLEWCAIAFSEGKAECWTIDDFELWCWRRLFWRVPWTARRSNQSILKEINPEYSLEGLMLKLKLQHFGHLKWRADSLEKTLMRAKIASRREGATEDEMIR